MIFVVFKKNTGEFCFLFLRICCWKRWIRLLDQTDRNPDPPTENSVGFDRVRNMASQSVSFFFPVLRIRDLYPWSRILIFTHSGSRISDPGSKNSNKREGWKKFVVKPFFVAINFTKLNIILFFKCWRKKVWASFQRIIELFTQKFVTKL